MVNRIKNAIANKLSELYPKSNIYDELVSQGFKKGSFFIDVIDQDYTHSLFKSGKSTVQFDISYFPNDKNKNNEMEEVKSNLLRALNVLDGFRLISKTSNIVDDVLHVQLRVQYREIKTETNIKIQQFDIKENLKEV